MRIDVRTVNRLFPFGSDARPEPDESVRVVEINDEAASDVFQALSSETTREIFASIYDEPGTASELADQVDTSLPNIKYHLDKLQEVDLIEVADTWYSEQGNEMNVYAPTDQSVVVVASNEESQSMIKEMLTRLFGALAVLLVGSLGVETLLGHFRDGTETPSSGGTNGGQYEKWNWSVEEIAIPRNGTLNESMKRGTVGNDSSFRVTAADLDAGNETNGVQTVVVENDSSLTIISGESVNGTDNVRVIVVENGSSANVTSQILNDFTGESVQATNGSTATLTPDPTSFKRGNQLLEFVEMLSPGMVFFAGGVFALLIILLYSMRDS